MAVSKSQSLPSTCGCDATGASLNSASAALARGQSLRTSFSGVPGGPTSTPKVSHNRGQNGQVHGRWPGCAAAGSSSLMGWRPRKPCAIHRPGGACLAASWPDSYRKAFMTHAFETQCCDFGGQCVPAEAIGSTCKPPLGWHGSCV